MPINNMTVSEARIIAEGMVKAVERSGEKIARGMIESAREIASAIIDNNTKNAEALGEGFRGIRKSLGGTKAELMMDVLLKQSEANGGNIPEPGSNEWNRCKLVAKQVLEEFSDEK
jgi:hypothetical protein